MPGELVNVSWKARELDRLDSETLIARTVDHIQAGGCYGCHFFGRILHLTAMYCVASILSDCPVMTNDDLCMEIENDEDLLTKVEARLLAPSPGQLDVFGGEVE